MLLLAGTAGIGGIAAPTSTRISARMQSVQEHGSPVNTVNTQARASHARPRGFLQRRVGGQHVEMAQEGPVRKTVLVTVIGRPIPACQYKHYYKSACS